MAAKIKELIKAATIARVTDKITHKFLGFVVKSNHTDEYYQVTCTKVAGECVWTCTCKAHEFGKECCHIKACKELCAARKQLNAERKEQERADWEFLHALDARPFPRFSKYSIAKADYHPDFNQKEESLIEYAERQREEAIKHGGFSLLKIA